MRGGGSLEQNQQEPNLTEQAKKKKTWWGGLVAVLVALGGKLKGLLTLLKLGKFGGTFISMAISVGAYAILFPWWFAVGLVLMIFVHEMGHVWAARIKGIHVSAPMFIPFFGALITLKKQPQDAATEAFIAYGGPLVGTLGGLICYGAGILLQQKVLIVIASVTFLINLFNLIPIHPLDGGRIVTAVTRWLWGVGLIVGLIAIWYLGSLILGFIYVLFLLEMVVLLYRKRKPKIQIAVFEVAVDCSRFEEAYLPIPGEYHRRELPYRYYSQLDSQQQVLEVDYPGIGQIAEIMDINVEIQRVELVQTITPNHNPLSDQRILTIQITYLPIRQEPVGGMVNDERYYSVPALTRWAYGLAYFGLIAFLVGMLYLTNTSFPN